MPTPDSPQSWFGASLHDETLESSEELQEFKRLWLGFMTARVVLALMLLLLHAALYLMGQAQQPGLMLLFALQLVAALMGRINPQPRRLGQDFDRYWMASIGVDLLVLTILQLTHVSSISINYTPLYALPVLQAAVLGSLTLAMGTAASITLLLLGHSIWQVLDRAADAPPLFIQTALTGAGSFVVAFVAHQTAARLSSVQQRERRSRRAMRIQRQVNDLVIDALTDGILVVDVRGTVHAANPAARQMLQTYERALMHTPFHLSDEPGWLALAELAFQAFSGRGDLSHADVAIEHLGQGQRRLRVRTRMTASHRSESEVLCVMFLQDQREIEARLRAEKLASMGRMSAAVAHEIRNPLAAIAQANDLLEEELKEPKLLRLTGMVRQNAQRLDRIVDDVLNVSRAGQPPAAFTPQTLELKQAVQRIAQDWQQQNTGMVPLRLVLPQSAQLVQFDAEHMRRVLVNLLDNARHHASRLADAVQIHVRPEPNALQVSLAVWSDGPPLEPTLEQHLFEPFFSSESRSSGLGLYICRQLCEGHGAVIGYHRARRMARNTLMDGNEFFISMRRTVQPAVPASAAP